MEIKICRKYTVKVTPHDDVNDFFFCLLTYGRLFCVNDKFFILFEREMRRFKERIFGSFLMMEILVKINEFG